jgi:hypothetical protein
MHFTWLDTFKRWTTVGLIMVVALSTTEGLVLAEQGQASGEFAAPFTKWSMAAQGCVVEPGSASRLTQDATGAVKFKGSQVGTAYLVCPVAVFTQTQDCMGLGITVADQAPPNVVNHVRAFLAALPIHEGSVSTPSGLESRAGIKHEDGVNLGQYAFDFDSNYYYVVIEMRRTAPGTTLAFFGTRLSSCRLF